jgi:hypothetical protein
MRPTSVPFVLDSWLVTRSSHALVSVAQAPMRDLDQDLLLWSVQRDQCAPAIDQVLQQHPSISLLSLASMVALSSLEVLSYLCDACARHQVAWLSFRECGSLPLFVFHIYLPRECTWIIRLKSGNWEYVEDACKCGEDLGRVGSQHWWNRLWQFQE